MKSIKIALMAGAAVAVSTAGAHADELSDLKAQVEALNARVAAMETAPSVPAGYQLLAISKGDSQQVPGLEMTPNQRFNEGNRATIISVMPTADAPAGTTISWSGYVRAAAIYMNDQKDLTHKYSVTEDGVDVPGHVGKDKHDGAFAENGDVNDWDVKARGQLKVVASTDTAVGEVGVTLSMRANFNGVAGDNSNVYMNTAWGYWAMTPELTLGGGFTGSLGNIGYGFDGGCVYCQYNDNADVAFDPGDTTQLRLSYASGPLSMAIALEDAGSGSNGANDNYKQNYNQLGVAGEIKYSGDSFSGEISGVYRSTGDYAGRYWGVQDNSKVPGTGGDINGLWQIGAGLGFNLGDMASISLAAAFGEGPASFVNQSGDVTKTLPINNTWWGVSGLVDASLSDTIHAEAAVGYKHRETDSGSHSYYSDYFGHGSGDYDVTDKFSGFDYDTWAIMGGLYYTPVDQLTIGLEGQWYTAETNLSTSETAVSQDNGTTYVSKNSYDYTNDNWSVDLVSVWRF